MFSAMQGFMSLGASRLTWLATFSGGPLAAAGATVDSSGNVYFINGYTTGATYSKLDQYGNLLLGVTRTLSKTGGAVANQGLGSSIAVDSTGQAYSTGITLNPGAAGSTDIILYKYSTPGPLIFQKDLGTGDVDRSYGIAVDSSGNIYTNSLASPSAGVYNSDLTKFTSAGVYSAGGSLGTGFPATTVYKGIYIDGSDNIYTVAQSTVGARRTGYIYKFTTSLGAATWGRLLSHATNSVATTSVTADSSGNVWAAGVVTTTAFVTKYNSSGTVLFTTGFSTGVGTITVTGLTTDTSNNVYIVGNSSGSTEGTWIGKLNSSGVLQWGRYFKNTSNSGSFVSINWVSTGQLVLAGTSSSVGFILRVPDDGTLTGTYGIYTYGVSTRTLATAPTYTDSSSSVSTGAQQFSPTTSTFTSGTVYPTINLTPVL